MICVYFQKCALNYFAQTSEVSLRNSHIKYLTTKISINYFLLSIAVGCWLLFFPTSTFLGQFSRHRVGLGYPLHITNSLTTKERRNPPESSHEKGVLISMNNHTTPKSWGGGGGGGGGGHLILRPPPPLKICGEGTCPHAPPPPPIDAHELSNLFTYTHPIRIPTLAKGSKRQ